MLTVSAFVETHESQGALPEPEVVLALARAMAAAAVEAARRGVTNGSALRIAGKRPDFVVSFVDEEPPREGFDPARAVFSSPERLRGDGQEHDLVYGLGVAMYWISCGNPPFQATSRESLLLAIAEQETAPLLVLRPQLGRAFSDLVRRCFASDEALRPRSIEELAEALEQTRVTARGSLASLSDTEGDAFDHLPEGDEPSEPPPPSSREMDQATAAGIVPLLLGLVVVVVAAGLSYRAFAPRSRLPMEDSSAAVAAARSVAARVRPPSSATPATTASTTAPAGTQGDAAPAVSGAPSAAPGGAPTDAP
jgi:hypothetical protein